MRTTPGAMRPAVVTALCLSLLAGCDDGIVDHREAGSTVPPEAIAWLQSRALPFDGTTLTLPKGDLDVLRELVGDARIVALGENTHGTREFFEMKARILRYLVEEMGFDAFAIEGSWPEANRIDHYVRTGEGDPAQLIAGMYFWTWRTRSVLEMTEWIRQHNAAGGDVGYYGFDMQFPGLAIHNLETYVDGVDPGALPVVQSRLTCLAEVANDASGAFPASRYGDLAPSDRDACRADLTWVHDELDARRDDYVTASSGPEFDRALRSARILLQYEAVESGLGTRDAAMAENAAWLLDQLGPDSRMVLWAHNYHVGYGEDAMGAYLHDAFGDQLVAVGFTHTAGTFTAASPQGFGAYTLDPVRETSYEAYFHSTSFPRFVLDLRPTYPPSDSVSWLAGPRWTRVIGCCFDPEGPAYWTAVRLPDQYDLVIHIDQTRSTWVLDARPPDEW